ncbi:MAG TPA: aminotransferase class IV [Thermotogota bacterium]|nr:aminotransferase class IV [Thermotogota bacterium]HPJ88541.1 aminotransferase class IV [Thermotogota bacterium]HPR96475.1 aminotransferase class IV [Thermotogota bacterium]
MKIFINGYWVNEEEAKISVENPGFTGAEMVYESIRTYQGKIFKFRKHYDRLCNSAEAMGLTVPLTLTEMEEKIYEGMKLNRFSEVNIKILITSAPDIILLIHEFVPYNTEIYKNGVKSGVSPIRRHAFMHNNTAIKSTAAIDVFLARIRRPAELFDWIMLNDFGYVAEGTFSNVFIVRENTLITPSLESGILSGITRDLILTLADKNGIKTEVRLVKEEELFSADELFITHTTSGITPVGEFEGKKIGVGPVTKTLLTLLNQFTDRESL